MQATLVQKVALAVLAAILAAVVWVQQGAENESADAPARAAAGAGADGAADGTAVGEVRLDVLQALRAQEDGTRNPFQLGVRPAPPAPPPGPPAPVLSPVVTAPGVPPIPLDYIGRIDLPRGRGLVAVLSDNRGNVFHGREGDVIEGRYRVLRVGPDSTDLAYLDGRGQQTFALSGQ
jgi:hypothetical protein